MNRFWRIVEVGGGWWRLGVALAAVATCTTSKTSTSLHQPAAATRYEPAKDLGALFAAVQLSGIFPDSKTFVDARPLLAPDQIVARYDSARRVSGFKLLDFVTKYFEMPPPPTVAVDFHTDRSQTMEQHIRALWPVLTRAPEHDTARYSSLIPLPQPYVVPGGRFREVYYWDSYFTMLGLIQSGRTDLVKSMLDNFAYLVRKVGHIPNGNRTYYLGRSQPPYFAAMVGLYAGATDTAQALPYLDALEAEHAFWMDGAERLAPGEAYRRVVKLRDGSVLNRYWDDVPQPRPESFREDFELGQTLPAERRELFYRNIRATAESGWDFSSRWMRDPKDLRTLETTELIPVDLNSLLYHAERIIAALRSVRGRPGDLGLARQFSAAAERRRQALVAAAFDSATGFFYDVRWRSGDRVTDRPTLAAAAPLYFGLATPEQGRVVAARLERDFLKPGGFVTTGIASGQQWDAPNGWPPLEWLSIEGARRYGRADLGDVARGRWLALNRRVYAATGKMTEKYDVVDVRRRAGGGEYPTQDGFGWSNGVALALGAEQGHEHGPESLGHVTFPVSCNAEAQTRFLRAMALLHSFWWEEGARAFKEVAVADTTCAMAYWGMAVTAWGNPFVGGPAGENLRRGAAAAIRAQAVPAPTARERGFIAAAAALYRAYETVPNAKRLQAYSDTLARLYHDVPDDPEVAIYYALSLVATASATDTTFTRQKQAAAILNPLFQRFPQHPGLAHYIIHANDSPELAPLGLEAARRYAAIAPAAPHAQHMPSHIFIRLGLWDETIAANQRAFAAGVSYAHAQNLGGVAPEQFHALDYMVYGYLQEGRDSAARRTVAEGLALTTPLTSDALVTNYNRVAMEARVPLERGDWAAAARLPTRAAGEGGIAEALTHFARGIGAARSGDTAQARVEVTALAAIEGSLAGQTGYNWARVVGIKRRAVTAWALFAGGDTAAALREAKAAADLEDVTEKHPVTPGELLPARELEGDLLLAARRPGDARLAYTTTLRRERGRSRSLFGLARAAELAGDRTAARTRYQEYLTLMQGSDGDRPDLESARRALSRL